MLVTCLFYLISEESDVRKNFNKALILNALIILSLIFTVSEINTQTLALDGTYVGGTRAILTPDGTYVGNNR